MRYALFGFADRTQAGCLGYGADRTQAGCLGYGDRTQAGCLGYGADRTQAGCLRLRLDASSPGPQGFAERYLRLGCAPKAVIRVRPHRNDHQ